MDTISIGVDMSKAVNKTLSEQLSDFLNLIANAKSSYNYFHSEMVVCDAATQDLLHQLELEDLSYSERAKLSTKLRDVRRERRVCKDSVEELEPIVKYIDEHTRAINDLKQTLGEIRKQERYHSNRTYFPRVITKGD